MKPLYISKKLFDRYGKLHTINHYSGLLAWFALAQTADLDGDDVYMKKCIDEMKLYPHYFKHPGYSFENYRVGGLAKAWLVMKGYMDEHRELVDEYAKKTLEAPVDSEGIVRGPYPTIPGRIQTWIDIVFAVCPFMLYAGIAFKNEEYIDFSVDQTLKMYHRFRDESCGLLHQCKGFMKDPDAISKDHWSRGNAWGYLGLAEFLKYLPKDHKHYSKIEKLYTEHSAIVIKYQNKKGFWRQELTEELSWEESSGTALFLYGLSAGIRLGILKDEVYKTAFERGIKSLAKWAIREDFSTRYCCEGCICPGHIDDKGSVKAYMTEALPIPDDVHSFGPFMLAMVEAHLYGIEDLEINKPEYDW